MTELNDNVKGAITSVLQSSSMDMDYDGDLQHGYHHRDTDQQLRPVVSETADAQVGNNTLDSTKQKHQQNNDLPIASTATGLPDPSAITSAIDHVENKEQDADGEPGIASTAIGLPASEPIIQAMEETGGNDEMSTQKNTHSQEKANNNTVTGASLAAVQNVIDKLVVEPSDSQDEPRPNPSKMKHNQQEPEKSCNRSHDSLVVEDVKLSTDSDVQNAQETTTSGVTDVDGPSTTTTTAASATSGHTVAMQEPTHTIIDDVTSVDPTPVEPVVENIVANIQDVEEPVMMEKEIIQDTLATTKTDTDGKTMDVKVEPIAENEVMMVTDDPAADEIKVEQQNVSSSDDINQKMANMVVTDSKTERMPVVEEPAMVDDVKMKPMDDDGLLLNDEPSNKDGTVGSNDINVKQQQRALVDKDQDECTVVKEHQPAAPIDGQSQAPQQASSAEQQDQSPVATSQDQSNAPKVSKCVIM